MSAGRGRGRGLWAAKQQSAAMPPLVANDKPNPYHYYNTNVYASPNVLLKRVEPMMQSPPQYVNTTSPVNVSVNSASNYSYTDDDNEPVIPGCICDRNDTQIMCQNCGMMFRGRVKTPCPIHPTVTYLLDKVECAKADCRSRNIVELKD